MRHSGHLRLRLLATAILALVVAGGSVPPALAQAKAAPDARYAARGAGARPRGPAGRALTSAVLVGAASGCGMLEVAAVPASGGDSRAARRAGGARLSPGSGVGRPAASGSSCDACASWEQCRSLLESAGAGTQIVPLKNGVMYVYTADTPAATRAIQAAVEQHHERLHALEAAGDNVRLCPNCRAIRGAAASGRVVHEVLNIDGGCIMVTTSPDPSMVAKIYAAAGISIPARVKS